MLKCSAGPDIPCAKADSKRGQRFGVVTGLERAAARSKLAPGFFGVGVCRRRNRQTAVPGRPARGGDSAGFC